MLVRRIASCCVMRGPAWQRSLHKPTAVLHRRQSHIDSSIHHGRTLVPWHLHSRPAIKIALVSPLSRRGSTVITGRAVANSAVNRSSNTLLQLTGSAFPFVICQQRPLAPEPLVPAGVTHTPLHSLPTETAWIALSRAKEFPAPMATQSQLRSLAALLLNFQGMTRSATTTEGLEGRNWRLLSPASLPVLPEPQPPACLTGSATHTRTEADAIGEALSEGRPSAILHGNAGRSIPTG